VLVETVIAARDAGLDGISFLAADLTSEAFNRPGGWTPARQMDVGLTADDLAALELELARLEVECAAEREGGFIAESSAKLCRIADAFAVHLGARAAAPARCNAPWVSAVVEVDGTVRPCFFHESVGQWKGAHGAGDPGLLDVVRSERATSFREQLDVATNPICQRCTCRLNLDATPISL
jgi:radical SAM protein with 4Fe4S-binding SPASM domain